ncbi:hypothetical protein [Psychroflexus aestuariivivens]|uniref:hypothetical protein n=1 Tax=Psychroflexus aestuariivivens TaxID=1795040 RepID=UPI000FD9C7A4|nr:hypothetical protein [Psychroflexus aestuariivivens]
MEIQRTIDLLTEFRKNTDSSKNRKYAENFIRILNELNSMQIDELESRRLNSELKLIQQNFEIESENVNVKSELKKFVKFLKSEFSMTTPWYYTYVGASIGLVITVFFGFISMVGGAVIGGLIGYFLDEKAKKEGRKLKTDLSEFYF